MSTNDTDEKRRPLRVRLTEALKEGVKHFRRKVPATDTKPVGENQSDTLVSLYEKIEKEPAYLNNLLVAPEVEKEYIEDIKYMMGLGYSEGFRGIRTEKDKTAEDTAIGKGRHLYDLSFALLTGKLEKLLRECADRKKQKDDYTSENNQQREYYEQLHYYYRHFPRNFSMLLFWLYFMTFLFLLLADIPLSVQLIRYGFNFRKISPDFQELLNEGQFWNVIRANWQILLPAIGISLSTIYIKVFYDEFIGGSYGQQILGRRKFQELYLQQKKVLTGEAPAKDTFNAEEEKMLYRDHRQSRWWKIGIWAFTLLTIVVLGLFRQAAFAIFEGHSKMPLFIVFLMFTAMTIMFPFIGGACLSIALSSLQNCIRLRQARKGYILSGNKLNAVGGELVLLEMRAADLRQTLQNWGVEEVRVEKYKVFFLACYRQAYRIGSTEPDLKTSHLDFYEKVLYFREKVTAKKINCIINKEDKP